MFWCTIMKSMWILNDFGRHGWVHIRWSKILRTSYYVLKSKLQVQSAVRMWIRWTDSVIESTRTMQRMVSFPIHAAWSDRFCGGLRSSTKNTRLIHERKHVKAKIVYVQREHDEKTIISQKLVVWKETMNHNFPNSHCQNDDVTGLFILLAILYR